jgi:spore maturation protein CgeB
LSGIKTRVLFVGETWQGSTARSMREGLAEQPTVMMSDIGEDHFFPRFRHLPLRLANRLLRPLQRRELASAVLNAFAEFHPDVVLVYKGAGVGAGLVREIRRLGTPVINVFPDCSPHPHGRHLQEAMGCYDLVISAKVFHPPLWRSVYGYSNPCVWVPHGYDPRVHYWADPPRSHTHDVALCCTWRLEYHDLMRSLGEALSDDRISVAIAGQGWPERRNQFPRHWQCMGPAEGRAYGEFLRSARIVIAPVNRQMVVRGVRQPGDEDTTRTYQLAAAQCFFLHQRTEYVATLYDEQKEVPFWSNAGELASLIRRWLPNEAGRQVMAARAHARAVPAYSTERRAAMVLRHIEKVIEGHNASMGSS